MTHIGKVLLAAFMGALTACAVMGVAGCLYLNHKVDQINKKVDASFTKAFGVTTSPDNENNGGDWCRDFYEIQGSKGDYATFKKKNCD